MLCPQVEIHDVNEAMRLIESSKDSLLKQQTNKGYTQNTVDRVYAAIRAMAEGSKTLKIQEIRDRFVSHANCEKNELGCVICGGQQLVEYSISASPHVILILGRHALR